MIIHLTWSIKSQLLEFVSKWIQIVPGLPHFNKNKPPAVKLRRMRNISRIRRGGGQASNISAQQLFPFNNLTVIDKV